MTTPIEWTDEVWNPVTGCDRVSPGCYNCYAERMAKRLAGRCGYPADEPFRVTLHPERLELPLRWRKPRRVFVDSMSDLFHPVVPDAFVGRVFHIMAIAEEHTFQVLTKRPQRARALLGAEDWGLVGCEYHWPLPNVWLGTSIESDAYAFRASHLRATPAAIRFLSLEPLLGPLPNLDLAGIDWVIVGGESGPGARPMHPDWVRDIRDRCVAAGVPFFFKQWGEWASRKPNHSGSALTGSLRAQQSIYLTPAGADVSTNDLNTFTVPAGWCLLTRVGKRAAGRELDGRTWDEYPA